MQQVFLTRGKIALVDDVDYELVREDRWCAHWDGWHWYPQRKLERKNGKSQLILMHRFLMGIDQKILTGLMVDHINGNGLDNRRCNLRLVTPSENLQNQHYGRGTSKYLGVHKVSKCKRWAAQIGVRGKNFYLGQFRTEEEARQAYIKAKKDYHFLVGGN